MFLPLGGRLSLEYLCNIFITGVKYNKENLVKHDRKSDYWTERKYCVLPEH